MIKISGRFIKTHKIWKNRNQFQRPEIPIKSQVKSHFDKFILNYAPQENCILEILQ